MGKQETVRSSNSAALCLWWKSTRDTSARRKVSKPVKRDLLFLGIPLTQSSHAAARGKLRLGRCSAKLDEIDGAVFLSED